MKYLLLSYLLLAASCTSSQERQPPPKPLCLINTGPSEEEDCRPRNTSITVTFVDKKAYGKSYYKISTRKGRELGRIRSIIGNYTVQQSIHTSPSARMVFIYENISDCSPEFKHYLVLLNPEKETFQAYTIEMPYRPGLPYRVWPSISAISDSWVELEWWEPPVHEKMQLEELMKRATPLTKDPDDARYVSDGRNRNP